MPRKVEKTEFTSPVKLTEKWLDQHKGHMLVWLEHTVFEGQEGIKYKECKCYTCSTVARKKIGKDKAVMQKKGKPSPGKRPMRRGRPRKVSHETQSAQPD